MSIPKISLTAEQIYFIFNQGTSYKGFSREYQYNFILEIIGFLRHLFQV